VQVWQPALVPGLDLVPERMSRMFWTRENPRAAVLGLAALLVVASAACKSSPKPAEPAAAAPPPAAVPQPVPAPAPPVPQVHLKDGRIADEEVLKRLVRDKTTKEEVREMFGVPQQIVFAPGTETYIYARDKSFGFLFSRRTERVESLTIRFNWSGILQGYEYRYSGD
jgi:hypothetical protein